MVRHFFEANKPVAAICHGAQLLSLQTCSKAGSVRHTRLASQKLKLAGGHFASIEVSEAVTDGNLVTAPAWPAHPAWLAQFMALLNQ